MLVLFFGGLHSCQDARNASRLINSIEARDIEKVEAYCKPAVTGDGSV